MSRTFMLLAAIFGFLGVAIGAFGAHGLAAHFAANPGSEDTYHTATQYQMYHALALLGVGILARESQNRLLRTSGYLFAVGIIFFSGSLYLLSVLNLRFMGAVAPIGGVAFLAGWACIAVFAWQKS
jgi:uncharacterized membrane protein YgdD (TMEM256/DUF423 family)